MELKLPVVLVAFVFLMFHRVIYIPGDSQRKICHFNFVNVKSYNITILSLNKMLKANNHICYIVKRKSEIASLTLCKCRAYLQFYDFTQ